VLGPPLWPDSGQMKPLEGLPSGRNGRKHVKFMFLLPF
jgi:hypothetical protein